MFSLVPFLYRANEARKEAEEMAQYAKEEEANEAAGRAMKERVERQKQQIAETKAKKEAEEMAQYAREEEENDKAARAMKDKIEKHKKELAEKKALKVRGPVLLLLLLSLLITRLDRMLTL
jgi:hypothetical protein